MTVILAEPTEADAEYAVMEFQAEHPSARFGPVHLAATGEWVASGDYESH